MDQLSMANGRLRTKSSQSFLMYILMLLMILVAFFQIYIFHSQTSYADGDLRMRTSQTKRRELIINDVQIKNINDNNRSHKDVIVYLAQFGKFHSSYGLQQDANKERITGLSKLNKSLDLLYKNYVNDFPLCDILIFYDTQNGPDNETMAELSKNRPQLQFRELKGQWWSLPHGLRAIERFKWNRPAFSIGYRHMIRWFAILIWSYLAQEGYTHVMRMDDDSYLHSKIQYNMFQYMRDNNKKYGFRMPVMEEAVGVGYDAIIDQFLETNPNNVTSQELINTFMEERYVGFYNNWFMAEISFFLEPPVSNLLNLIDSTDIIYTQRTGDLVIHSTAVRLFLHPNQIQYFRDFTYEHITLCRKKKCGPWVTNGCPQNGGIARGAGVYTDDEWYAFTKEVMDRFSGKHCVGSLMNGIDFIGAEDIRYCTKVHSRCRPYMELLLGINNVSNAT